MSSHNTDRHRRFYRHLADRLMTQALRRINDRRQQQPKQRRR